MNREKVEEIAKKKNSEYDGIPDCHDVSQDIAKELVREHDVDASNLFIVEYFLDGYRHYALKLGYDVTGEELVVDASFEQFSNSRDTPIDLGENVQKVVVVQDGEYIFFRDRNSIDDVQIS